MFAGVVNPQTVNVVAAGGVIDPLFEKTTNPTMIKTGSAIATRTIVDFLMLFQD